MPPWELNGWLQYGDGKFMYFQTGGWCPLLLGVSRTFLAIEDIWSGDGIVCGWPLARAGHEEIIYPRFIVKLLTALERLGPHLATWTGHGTSRVKCDFWAGILLIIQSRSHVPPVCPENHCVPRVTWGQGTKTHSGERSRCSLTGTQPFKRAARGLRGLSTEHLPQFKLELGHEKFKMDPCNF